jgi:hypothetical protein
MDAEQFKTVTAILRELLKQSQAQTELLVELRDAQLAPDDDGLQPGEEEKDGCMYMVAKQASKQTGSQLTVFMYSGHKDVTQPVGKCYSENWGALPFIPDTTGPVWAQRSSPSKQEAIDGGFMKMLPWTVRFIKKEKEASKTGGWPGKPYDRTVRVEDQHGNVIPWKPGQKLDVHQAPPSVTAPSQAAQAAATPAPAAPAPPAAAPAAAPAAPPAAAPAAPPAAPPAATTQERALATARNFYKAACRKVANDMNNENEHKLLYAAIALQYSSDLVKKGVPNVTVIQKPSAMTIEQLTEIATDVNNALAKWRKWWDDAIAAGTYTIPTQENAPA